jgi:plasmid stabilization system protein ParE
MTRVELSPQVFDDFDRFFDHIAQFDAGTAPRRIGEILEAIDILTHSPLIGRPVSAGNRELVIGRAARGYVALYRYVAAMDTVFVLAVRAQRGDGFKLPP